MRRIVFHMLAVIALFGCLPAHAEEASAGLRHERVRFHEVDYDVVRVDLKQCALELHWKDGAGKAYNNFARLREGLALEHRTLLFATNAGIYAKDDTPLGLYVEERKTLQALNMGRGGRGNFFLKPNGVFYVQKGVGHVVTADAYQASPPVAELAVQSGPMLVIDGALHPKFQTSSDSKNVRNGVGVATDGAVVFVISRAPVNFHDFASIFLEQLDCKNALYLDGNLSGMYAPFAGREDMGLHYVGMFAVTAPKEP